ncbi:YafY family transcriptional regulator [bacterium D16-51]|nr:YafY family transcriptional regulator [bacterium D16-59]RKI55622.1 YafY family transcriptional regulator [bacterium D16-51]
MKIDRLIGILSILLQKDKITSQELANKFEVSRRTILRDVDALNMAGIPIISEQGQGGGISIMEGYKVDRTVLSSEDMKAILTGLQSLDSISGTNRYRQLMEKISVDDSASANVDNHIIIDLSNWDKSKVSDKIELIKAAMEQDVKISFHYFSQNGESWRMIEPYHLVFQWSDWYVWGYCMQRKDFRMFKLMRITELALTDEKISDRIVPEYICKKLWDNTGGVEAVVKFDASVKWRIIDEFGADFLKYNENGDIIVTITWSNIPALYQYVLSFGDKAEIITPMEYRQNFAKFLKKMLDKYEM